jgi:hypothetical protein
MQETTSRQNTLGAMKEHLEGLANSRRVPPGISQAVRELLTAINYADETLINSSLHALREALRLFVRDIVQRELEVTEITKNHIQEGWRKHVDGAAAENFDELKKLIESFIDERITSMTGARDELVKILEEKEYPVENAQQLENSIRDLRRFRENILKEWPSPGRRPAPLNRQAIAEARAAIARGEKGLRKDELVWGNDPSNPNS